MVKQQLRIVGHDKTIDQVDSNGFQSMRLFTSEEGYYYVENTDNGIELHKVTTDDDCVCYIQQKELDHLKNKGHLIVDNDKLSL